MDDDPTMRRIQKVIVDRLKDHKDPVIAEMAREIAAGRLTPREALCNDVYGEAVFKGGSETFSRIAAMPDSERDALAEQGWQDIEEELADQGDTTDTHDDQRSTPSAQPAIEATTPRRVPRRRPEVEDDEPPNSIMVGVRSKPAAPPNRPAEPVAPAAPHTALPRSVRDRAGGRRER